MFTPPPPPPPPAHPAAVTAPSTAPAANLIEINRTTFRLKLFERTETGYRLVFKYKVAVGKPGYATPPGVFIIQRAALNPTWTAPDSPWVEQVQRGKAFDGNDPNNPIVGAFLAIDTANGIGIHGTRDIASLGSRASHGCIRMTRKAATSLFHRVPLGTPVVVE